MSRFDARSIAKANLEITGDQDRHRGGGLVGDESALVGLVFGMNAPFNFDIPGVAVRVVGDEVPDEPSASRLGVGGGVADGYVDHDRSLELVTEFRIVLPLRCHSS